MVAVSSGSFRINMNTNALPANIQMSLQTLAWLKTRVDESAPEDRTPEMYEDNRKKIAVERSIIEAAIKPFPAKNQENILAEVERLVLSVPVSAQ